MRTIFIFLLLAMFDLAPAQNTVFNMSAIPSGGASVTITPYQSPTIVYVGTGGSPINLGANSYTLAYTSLPPTGTGFDLYFDATQLTAIASHVTLFGYQPLVKVPNAGFYHLRYDWDGSTVTVTCYQDAANSTNVINRTTFNDVYVNDSLVVKRFRLSPQTPISVGAVAIAGDTSGNITFGCPPCAWNILGNTGTGGGASFVGTIDTADLRFRVDNLAAGIIGYNKFNTGFGLVALAANTSGTDNTALGYGSLQLNTTGANNVGIGSALQNATTASNNTAIGEGALGNATTGGNNIAVGQLAGNTVTTGTLNTVLGYHADVSASASASAIAIGANAVASSHQCAIAGVENLYLNGTNNHVGYALIDTSGTGNFVPQPVPSTTPLIDSVTGTSSQTFTLSNNQTNILTASTTVAGATLAFPAVQSGTIVVIWKVATTTTAISGTNTGTTIIPASVAAGTSRTFINLNGSWY